MGEVALAIISYSMKVDSLFSDIQLYCMIICMIWYNSEESVKDYCD